MASHKALALTIGGAILVGLLLPYLVRIDPQEDCAEWKERLKEAEELLAQEPNHQGSHIAYRNAFAAIEHLCSAEALSRK